MWLPLPFSLCSEASISTILAVLFVGSQNEKDIVPQSLQFLKDMLAGCRNFMLLQYSHLFNDYYLDVYYVPGNTKDLGPESVEKLIKILPSCNNLVEW